MAIVLGIDLSAAAAEAPRLTLAAMVEPSSVFVKDGRPVTFALNGFVEFQTLAQLFTYIDRQAGRWRFGSDRERQAFGDALVRRAVESRLISMVDETPLELLLTHTAAELGQAAEAVRTADRPLVFQGVHWRLTADVYRDAFLRVRSRWTSSINCWSASPSIAARVLSNWYLIEEGIRLFGATYDSTEHFWQAVKYHPDVRVRDLEQLLAQMDGVDWPAWLARLDHDQDVALPHAYAIEFLRANLTPAHRAWFHDQLTVLASDNEPVRRLQQKRTDTGSTVRFTALTEKTLWGDLADVLHLVRFFAGLNRDRYQPPDLVPFLNALDRYHFDAIYLAGYRSGRVGFISPDFQELMLEIWKVKYLTMERFGEVIRSTAGVTLDHFLNDGDSPDIPIPVYVRFLNQIRDIALRQKR